MQIAEQTHARTLVKSGKNIRQRYDKNYMTKYECI